MSAIPVPDPERPAPADHPDGRRAEPGRPAVGLHVPPALPAARRARRPGDLRHGRAGARDVGGGPPVRLPLPRARRAEGRGRGVDRRGDRRRLGAGRRGRLAGGRRRRSASRVRRRHSCRRRLLLRQRPDDGLAHVDSRAPPTGRRRPAAGCDASAASGVPRRTGLDLDVPDAHVGLERLLGEVAGGAMVALRTSAPAGRPSGTARACPVARTASSGCGTGSPSGGLTGLGTSPVRMTRLRFRSSTGSGTGTADSSARV